jgi:hypothetical protein
LLNHILWPIKVYDSDNPEEFKPAEEFILLLDPKPYTEQAELTFRERVLPLAEPADLPEAQAMLSAVARTLGDRYVWIHANNSRFAHFF